VGARFVVRTLQQQLAWTIARATLSCAQRE